MKDVISYGVTKPCRTEARLGDKCGSIFINIVFKKWLRKLLGPELYQQLNEEQINHNISSHDAE